ncbi:MAG: FkbM family methyltransferase [Planctomycetota bacterium]|jgi:FkbM family methyltransferase
MTEPHASDASTVTGDRPGLVTRVARSAARWLRGYAGQLSSGRLRLSAAKKLLLTALFLPPFCVCYTLLKLQVRLHGPLTEESLTSWGSRIETRLPDLIQMYIYLFGVWEPDITVFIRDRLGTGDTFIDVGANVGYHTLLAAKHLGGAGRVAAIEASPAIHQTLQENLARNDGTDGVRTVNMAASDAPGTVRIHHGPVCNVGLSTTLESRGFAAEADVPAAPLEDLLEPQEIETARLVKIDVEGGEDRVLAGMQGFLEKCPSHVEILVELSPAWWSDHRRTPQEVLEPLLDAGFHAYRIDNTLWPWRYLWPNDVHRPRRVRQPLLKRVKRIDLVLSRADQDEL